LALCICSPKFCCPETCSLLKMNSFMGVAILEQKTEL
jgi:hypothetical protein